MIVGVLIVIASMVDTTLVMIGIILVSYTALYKVPREYWIIYVGKLINHKYENAMTIQKTAWGYIRNTDISGYLTIHDLLYELVTTVRYVNIIN